MSNVDTTDTLIHAIQDGEHAKIVQVEGREFVTKPVQNVPPPFEYPTMPTLHVATLSGLIDYLKNKIDGEQTLFLHVVSHTQVDVVRHLRESNKRDTPVSATYEVPRFNYGAYYEQADFITAIRALFEDTPDRDVLLGFVSGLTADSSKQMIDDGVAQQTIVRRGLRGEERTATPGVLQLQPHRTFPEVAQPTSAFILRLRPIEDEEPTMAIFEADNAGWKVDATNNIKAYLEGLVKDGNGNVPVIA